MDAKNAGRPEVALDVRYFSLCFLFLLRVVLPLPFFLVSPFYDADGNRNVTNRSWNRPT